MTGYMLLVWNTQYRPQVFTIFDMTSTRIKDPQLNHVSLNNQVVCYEYFENNEGITDRQFGAVHLFAESWRLSTLRDRKKSVMNILQKAADNV